MKDWIWRVFPPREVKLTLRASRAFFTHHAALSRCIIEPEVTSLIKDAGKTVSSIRDHGMTPDHWALVLVTQVVKRQLTSGAQHIYLGVLSAIGTDMLSLWHHARMEMHERGYMTETDLAQDGLWVKEQINRAGRHGQSEGLENYFVV